MTRPLVVHDDAVAAAIEVLNDALPTLGHAVTAHTRVPNPRPASFVRVRRTGGIASGVVLDRALLSLDCYAATEADAHDLAQAARGVLGSVRGIHGTHLIVSSAEAGGPVQMPDPETDQPRYTLTVELTTRSDEA